MTQADAVRAWWADLDRGRVLRGDEDNELLAEDLAVGLAAHGVTVVPAGPSPVNGHPDG